MTSKILVSITSKIGLIMIFSIVVPLYNKCYSIKRCIDSLLNQDYTSFEIIIVNDGSTDDSLSIVLETYHDEISHNLIKVIDQTNKGVSATRNTGIKESKSEYVCLIDADDEWKPNFLSKIFNLIMDYPRADLYCLAHLVKKEGAKVRKPKLGLNNNHRGYVNDFFKSSSKGEVANSSKVCVKKQAILSFGGFPEGVVAGEDLYVWIMLALKGKVACEMSYSVIIHQKLDESRSARRNSVPYPLVFFSEKNNRIKNKSLRKYLFFIFHRHFLGSLYHLQFEEAYIRAKVYIKTVL